LGKYDDYASESDAIMACYGKYFGRRGELELTVASYENDRVKKTPMNQKKVNYLYLSVMVF